MKKGLFGIKSAKIDKSKTSSSAARRYLKHAINAKETVNVVDDPGNGNHVPGANLKEIHIDALEGAQVQGAASVGLNSETVGMGMIFIHELGHTVLGGEKIDPSNYNSYSSGANEGVSNKIRRQMGSSWGQRESYMTHRAPDGHNYMPFDLKAEKDLKSGKVPTTLFLKF